uniref:Large ribosomal subunit protein uL22c n=1 Tax=Phacus inflexus TaxID=461210 RepID=A0A3G3LKT0_9EUGL|nr:ribosomal protein L22 [Phacus inflexus]AYQ93324.1 ribosomal protein L22 [Phacus inflexus]
MTSSSSLEARAISRYVRVSPYKVRRILNQIRGRSYQDSVILLKYMPYKVCSIILKILFSAVSNAKQSFGKNDNLFVISEARADEAPFLKRFRPHAQGRGFPIKKRMSHIIIKVKVV